MSTIRQLWENHNGCIEDNKFWVRYERHGVCYGRTPIKILKKETDIIQDVMCHDIDGIERFIDLDKEGYVVSDDPRRLASCANMFRCRKCDRRLVRQYDKYYCSNKTCQMQGIKLSEGSNDKSLL